MEILEPRRSGVLSAKGKREGDRGRKGGMQGVPVQATGLPKNNVSGFRSSEGRNGGKGRSGSGPARRSRGWARIVAAGKVRRFEEKIRRIIERLHMIVFRRHGTGCARHCAPGARPES